MVALRVVFYRNLPIAALRDVYPFKRFKFGPVWHPFFQLSACVRKPILHRVGIWIKVHKNKAEEFFGAHFSQANGGFIKSFNGIDVWSGTQLSCQFVRPSMIRADK